MNEKKIVNTGRRSVRWIFNSLMIWSAVCGVLIVTGYYEILGTWHHKGPGVVWYDDGDEQVSEEQYKRHNYTMGAFGLVLGLLGWIYLAHSTKKDADKNTANKDYLNARIKTNDAYNYAFVRVMGADAYNSVAAEVKKDPEYQAAKADESAKFVAYNAAAKNAKGDE